MPMQAKLKAHLTSGLFCAHSIHTSNIQANRCCWLQLPRPPRSRSHRLASPSSASLAPASAILRSFGMQSWSSTQDSFVRSRADRNNVARFVHSAAMLCCRSAIRRNFLPRRGGRGKEEEKFIWAAPLIPRAISPDLIEFPQKYACARAD